MRSLPLIVAVLCPSVCGAAVTNPFTETFATDASGWRNANVSADLGFVPAGSFNGSGYASGSYNFMNNLEGDTPAILRGQDEFGFSGGAFEGDWIVGGVTEFTAFVRHDAPVPLNFFTRFSGPGNFPGAIGVSFIPVAPNTWTPIQIAIDASNPQFISFEGEDFATVFGASPLNGFQGIGHVQIGVDVPAALAGLDQEFTFDLDNPSITPTPGTLALIVGSGLLAGRRRRGG